MGDEPPPYEHTNNSPSAPPAYFQSLPGEETKGIDWSLNTSPRPSPRYIARPAPSAPPISEAGTSSSSKCIDWSLNTPQPPTRTVSRPNNSGYPGSSSHPVYPGSRAQPSSHQPSPGSSKRRGGNPAVSKIGSGPEPTNPFLKWKTEFSRHYPGAKFSRDTPSILKVEIPKNRAFPVMGHATCPDCFDNGPHQPQNVKKKDGLLSVKKLPAQKCRHCSKLVYFVHSDNLVEDHLPRDKPPPYTNRPSQIGFNNNPYSAHNFGHGWGSGEEGHGWDPGEGEGHGWGR
ncbi:hypothetical protein ACHWQZ_G006421 [Mnemiopsis leidyi]